MSLLIYSGMLASLLALGRCRHLTVCCWRDSSRGCLRQWAKRFVCPGTVVLQFADPRKGVGTAVAVGRLGAMSGPLLAGKCWH